jgi:PAS domain S-box-containing protein
VDGSLMGVVMVFRDVTGAYATHAELEQSKRQLDLAVRSAELGIWDWDAATDRVSMAGRQAELFGFGPDETVVPLSAFQARIHADDWQPTMAVVAEAMETGHGFDCVFRVVLPDGGLRWVRSIGSPIRPTAEGEGLHVIGTARDVTDRKHSEDEARRTMDALIRSNAELERFAYVASHDLQEPIRSIVAYSQLLGQRHGDRLDGEAREFLAFIIDGGKRMQALVLDLLDYSRVATRARPFAPVDPLAVIRAALENLRLSIADSGATVTVQEPLPPVVGDETQLVSLMQNLIGNAIKFHRPGAPPIVTIDGAREDDMAVIRVTDNGIGIAAEHHDQVFQIFKRLHGTDEFPGTGVGLALAKRIVEHHGGTISLDSRPDEGCRFTIRLPLSSTPAGDSEGV